MVKDFFTEEISRGVSSVACSCENAAINECRGGRPSSLGFQAPCLCFCRQFQPVAVEEQEIAFNVLELEYFFYCFTVNIKLRTVVVFPGGKRALILYEDRFVIDHEPFSVLYHHTVHDAADERAAPFVEKRQLRIGAGTPLKYPGKLFSRQDCLQDRVGIMDT